MFPPYLACLCFVTAFAACVEEFITCPYIISYIRLQVSFLPITSVTTQITNSIYAHSVLLHMLLNVCNETFCRLIDKLQHYQLSSISPVFPPSTTSYAKAMQMFRAISQ
jgi:hypothetical protein